MFCTGAKRLAVRRQLRFHLFLLRMNNIRDWPLLAMMTPVLSCLHSAGGRTVWYTFTSDSLIFLEASTEDSRPFEYNTVLAVFSGVCNSLVEIACNDDIVTGSLLQSNIQFRAEAGITYYIQVAESDAPGEWGRRANGWRFKIYS